MAEVDLEDVFYSDTLGNISPRNIKRYPPVKDSSSYSVFFSSDFRHDGFVHKNFYGDFQSPNARSQIEQYRIAQANVAEQAAAITLSSILPDVLINSAELFTYSDCGTVDGLSTDSRSDEVTLVSLLEIKDVYENRNIDHMSPNMLALDLSLNDAAHGAFERLFRRRYPGMIYPSRQDPICPSVPMVHHCAAQATRYCWGAEKWCIGLDSIRHTMPEEQWQELWSLHGGYQPSPPQASAELPAIRHTVASDFKIAPTRASMLRRLQSLSRAAHCEADAADSIWTTDTRLWWRRLAMALHFAAGDWQGLPNASYTARYMTDVIRLHDEVAEIARYYKIMGGLEVCRRFALEIDFINLHLRDPASALVCSLCLEL